MHNCNHTEHNRKNELCHLLPKTHHSTSAQCICSWYASVSVQKQESVCSFQRKPLSWLTTNSCHHL